MGLPRRRVLFLGGMLVGWLSGMRSGVAAAPSPAPLAALPAFLDTLLPGDHLSPSATCLGIHEALRAGTAGQGEAMALLEAGCAWLDGQARRTAARDFAALPAPARITIAARAESGPAGSPERRFFHSVRHTAFRLYYTDPRSWGPLGYDGPPQPRGFPDHAQPPHQ